MLQVLLLSDASPQAGFSNAGLLHAGSGYDADRHRRYMRQTRVSGTCSSLDEAA